MTGAKRIQVAYRLPPEAVVALESRAQWGERSSRLGRDILLFAWLLERGEEEADSALPTDWRAILAQALPRLATWPPHHCAYLPQEAARCGAAAVADALRSLSPAGLAAAMDAVERKQRGPA